MFDNKRVKAKNREVIGKLFDVVKILTRNGLPLGENSYDREGNFLHIVKPFLATTWS
jgi:hypothetical protein